MDNRGHSTTPTRQEWVDVARGIGILAVVVGHVWTHGALRDAMYSFHMPLFFLLSGYLARPYPPAAFTRRQLAGQMRPYAAWLTILIVADQIIERLKGGTPIFHQWPQDVLPILLGGFWLRGPFTIFWFVPCLMAGRILFNMALNHWPAPLNPRWAWVLVPATVLAYALDGWTAASPLGLLTVPMAFVLLWIGNAWAQVRWRGVMVGPMGLAALAGLTGLVPTLNMKAVDYGAPLLSMVAAVATSLLIFRLSVHMAFAARPLASLGRASLILMYLHVAVIHYLTPYVGKVWLLGLALLGPWAVAMWIARSPRARRWLA